jgi:hypothetical protein
VEEIAPYGALMAASQPLIAQEVIDCYPIRQNRHRTESVSPLSRYAQAIEDKELVL